jgi:hypothetical protein
LGNRVLGFDEENYLSSKYLCWDSANKGERLLEVIQGMFVQQWICEAHTLTVCFCGTAFLINSWWAFSYVYSRITDSRTLNAVAPLARCGRWFDVWGMSSQAMRLSIALGLNFNDTMHQSLPYHIRSNFLIDPPQSYLEAELRRNIFWLIYAVHRLHLIITPLGEYPANSLPRRRRFILAA